MATVTVLNTSADLTSTTLVTRENAYTITGLHTFDRDPSAPFAVTASSAVVTNLDADKLDGEEGSAYHAAANITGTTLASNVVTSSLTTLGTIVTAPNVDLLNAVNTHTANGSHTWTCGTNGAQRLVSENTTSNTAALSGFRANAGTNILTLSAYSQGYTTGVSDVQDGGSALVTGAGGFSLAATHASGDLRFYSRNALGLTIGASQLATFTGAATVTGALTAATGKFGTGTISSSTVIVGSTGESQLTIASDTDANSADTDALLRFTIDDTTLKGLIGYDQGTDRFVIGYDGTAAIKIASNAVCTFGAASIIISNSTVDTAAVNAGDGNVQCGGLTQTNKARGTGATSGNYVTIGRNSSGNGAPGFLRMTDKADVDWWLWVDTTGDLRISSGGAPQEDGTPSDTSGTIVGTQS